MGSDWVLHLKNAEHAPAPPGFAELFDRGPVKIFKLEDAAHVLFEQSSDERHIMSIARKIDPEVTHGSWGGDLVLNFRRPQFEEATSKMASTATAAQIETPAVK